MTNSFLNIEVLRKTKFYFMGYGKFITLFFGYLKVFLLVY